MATTTRPNPLPEDQKKNSLPFRKRAHIAMIELDLTVKGLAEELGVAPNTITLAINNGLFKPTREKISKRLNIPLTP